VDGRVLVLEGGGASLRITASAPLLDGHGVMDVIWEGTSYVVALRFQKDSRWYLGVKRLDNKGVETEAMRAVVTNPPEFSDAPGIAGASGLGILLGNQETDLVNGTRAMVYREDDPRPRRRSVR